MVDTVDGGAVVARSRADAPEVDGRVLIDTDRPLRPGQVVEVEITASDHHDLWARTTDNG
jgi:ribosomal protein S12 methylthiotransferase